MKIPHLFVIDDCQTMQMFLQRMLSRQFTVTTLSSGEEAIQQLQSGSDVDLILMDMDMNGMSGFETLRTIREGGYSMPIIMLSGISDSNQRVACLEAGANDYLMKPFNPKELMVRINAILKISQSIASPPMAAATVA